MCGRYRLTAKQRFIAEHFDIEESEVHASPRYNIAPTQPVPVIRQHPEEPRRDLSLMRWGFIPPQAKDSSLAASMINARSETLASLPAFREAFQLRRCIVPADGFYEWQRSGSTRQPFCFVVNDGELFAFAGLWSGWRGPDGLWIKSFTILTTTPNAVTSTVHDRMPVILDKNDYDLWLDPGMKNTSAVAGLLKPFDARRVQCYPVSSRINHVQNDDIDCSAPVVLEPPPQRQLFGS